MRYAIGCALVLVAGAVTRNVVSQDVSGFSFAEGLTSAAPNEPIHLEFRMFTVNSKVCEQVATPVALTSIPQTITMRIGQVLPVSSLILRATDASGALIAGAPIIASVLFDPQILAFSSDNSTRFAITAVRQGNGGTLSFRAYCSDDSAPLRLRVPIVVAP